MSDTEEKRRVQKLAAGIGGGAVLLVGIIAIPYPGPGWLIVFAGLAILAREFPWAERWLKYGRKKYDEWNAWVKRQHWSVKIVLGIVTAIIVIFTIYLLNGYGLINDLFHLNQSWLRSPLVS